LDKRSFYFVRWKKRNVQHRLSSFLSRKNESLILEEYWKKFEKETYLKVQTQSYQAMGFSSLQGMNYFCSFRPGRLEAEEILLLHLPIKTQRNQCNYSLNCIDFYFLLIILSVNIWGMMISLEWLKIIMRQSYWSKNVILLFTDSKKLAVQAWLETYLFSPSPFLGNTVHKEESFDKLLVLKLMWIKMYIFQDFQR
jgi:hypothetical protein